MAQQTAVFYIEDNLVKVKEGHQYIVLGGEEYINIKHIKSIVEQAKAMEKEQIVDAFYEGMQTNTFDPNKGRALIYYNKTYNK